MKQQFNYKNRKNLEVTTLNKWKLTHKKKRKISEASMGRQLPVSIRKCIVYFIFEEIILTHKYLNSSQAADFMNFVQY